MRENEEIPETLKSHGGRGDIVAISQSQESRDYANHPVHMTHLQRSSKKFVRGSEKFLPALV